MGKDIPISQSELELNTWYAADATRGKHVQATHD